MLLNSVVYDATNNSPLAGASVVEVGTQNGTETDGQGAFSLNVTDDVALVAVSYVGYKTIEQEADGYANMIYLEPSNDLMNSVVVTAIKKNPVIAIIILILIVLIFVYWQKIASQLKTA